jgi:hypothetical protein
MTRVAYPASGRWLLAAAVVALLLGGCGRKSDTLEVPPEAAPPAPAPAAPP